MIYIRKIEALFSQDPEVRIDYDLDDMEITLWVDNPTKAVALEEILPDHVEFGNVELYITVVPANNVKYSIADMYRMAFSGNPVFVKLESVDDPMAFSANYCIFKNEVVQYPADDLGSYYGIESTLYEDIADEVFEGNHDGVFFCTDVAKA